MSSIRAADAPAFDNYKTQHIYRGKPAEPQFRVGEDVYPNGVGQFRRTVTFQAEHGPNFAGHYTLARWSCGSGCSGIVIVDSLTGKLYGGMPFRVVAIPFLPEDLEPYLFRLDSRLFIAQGYFDIDVPDDSSECSRRYYEWTGASFKLLQKVVLKCSAVPQRE